IPVPCRETRPTVEDRIRRRDAARVVPDDRQHGIWPVLVRVERSRRRMGARVVGTAAVIATWYEQVQFVVRLCAVTCHVWLACDGMKRDPVQVSMAIREDIRNGTCFANEWIF